MLGEKIWEGTLPKSGESGEDFVKRILKAEIAPEPPFVPDTIYWATKQDQVVGKVALRHFLNENLKQFGGHIGYEVRPSQRRQGIATEMLRLLLQTPKAKEIGRLLLTCAPTNLPSIKTIEANGGLFEKTAFVEKQKRDTNYYWIDLTKNASRA